MENKEFKFYIPSDEHIADLKSKGIDIEVEMARLVCDTLKAEKEGKGIRSLTIATSKEQMEEVSKYGINVAEAFALEFKDELHNFLTGKRLKEKS